MVEKLPRSAARSRCAATRSGIEAAVTTTASSRPFTSAAMCRLTPFVFLAPSQPRLDRGTVSAAGTDLQSGVRGGYGLRVDDRRGRTPVPPGPHPQSVAQRVEDALPRPAAGPAGEDRVPRRGWGGTPRELPPRDSHP